MIGIWPPMVSVSAGFSPLYGTWFILTPSAALKSSPAMCGEEPMPPEPKVSALAPLFFASTTNSAKVFGGNDGCTTISSGDEPASVIGVKSFAAS